VKHSNTMSKTLQGKEGFNHAFITAENAEGRGKNGALFPTFRVFCVFRGLVGMIYTNLFVTAQSIVSGAPLSAARIPSRTGKPFFRTVEM
jgi:hypothetical protein